MPITEAAKEALRALKLVQPTMVRPWNDLGFYDTLMEREDVPLTASPSVEIQWVAFKAPKPNFVKDPARKAAMCRAIWEDAPSKVAATWLRQLRLKKRLQDKFWAETWPYYIESRLSLELRAASPPAARRRGGGSGGGDGGLALQASIDQFRKKDGKSAADEAG